LKEYDNIPSDWESVKFSNIAELRHGHQFRQYDFTDEGVKVFKITQIKGNGQIDLSSCDYIDENRLTNFEKYRINKGDILVALTGATIGKTARYNKSETVLQNYRVGNFFSKDEKVLSKDYLFQYLRSNYFFNQILALQTQSAQQNIGKDDINNMIVILPKIKEQKAIASILSSLDDKIELNLEMNKTLEEMAMAIYKEWFLDFGPFRDGEFVDSELGRIPKGWKIVSFADITTKITDGAHHSPRSQIEGIPMASVKDMNDWGFNLENCRKISKSDFNKLVMQGCRPLKNDVLIAKDGSYLKHSFVVEDDLNLVLLSSIAILRPNERINPHLLNLYLKLESVKDSMKSIVTGAVIQRIVLRDFRKFRTLLPPIQIQQKAFELIEPIIKQCWMNIKENNILRETRDYLLPKLISGEIRIKEAEGEMNNLL